MEIIHIDHAPAGAAPEPGPYTDRLTHILEIYEQLGYALEEITEH